MCLYGQLTVRQGKVFMVNTLSSSLSLCKNGVSYYLYEHVLPNSSFTVKHNPQTAA